jgi:uncharacterized Zn finger protein
MAASKCPKCDRLESFEMVEKSDVRGSQYKVMFIQCAACGTVVGVTEYSNVGFLVRKLAEKLRIDLFS